MNEKELIESIASGENSERAKDLLEKMEGLKSSEAWAYMKQVLMQQYQMRMSTLLSTPLTSMDQVPQQEYTKGECASLLILVHLVDSLVEYLKEMTASTAQDPDVTASP
jgi:hypothetical protein